MTNGRRTLLPFLLGCMAFAMALSTIGGCAKQRSPNAELTVDEGHALLLEIRDNPTRMGNLTIQERRFLAKSLADNGAADR